MIEKPPLTEIALRLPDQIDHGRDRRNRLRAGVVADNTNQERRHVGGDIVASPPHETRR